MRRTREERSEARRLTDALFREARKQSPYYLAQEARQARRCAQRVKAYEASGRLGAWRIWQEFIDQWHVDSPERSFLVQVFGNELDMLDDEDEYDPSMADIW